MKSVFHIILCAIVLLLVGCDFSAGRNQVKAQVGMRAFIKESGRDFEAIVTNVQNRIVTTEVRWRDRALVELDYYRGLYPVAGMEPDGRFELDFNEADIEALFPLEVGNKVHFAANMKFVEDGRDLDLEVIMTVKGETVLDLDDSRESVFVIDIVTQSANLENERRLTRNTVYYAPELSMILKSVSHEGGEQRFWRVVRIERGSGIIPRKRQRPGTVAI